MLPTDLLSSACSCSPFGRSATSLPTAMTPSGTSEDRIDQKLRPVGDKRGTLLCAWSYAL